MVCATSSEYVQYLTKRKLFSSVLFLSRHYQHPAQTPIADQLDGKPILSRPVPLAAKLSQLLFQVLHIQENPYSRKEQTAVSLN